MLRKTLYNFVLSAGAAALVLAPAQNVLADPLVDVSGSGVQGQARLTISDFSVVAAGGAGPSQYASGGSLTYSSVAAHASTTVNGVDPSLSEVHTGPSFQNAQVTVDYDSSASQTYAQSTLSSPTSFSVLAEGIAGIGDSLTADSTTVLDFYFTVASGFNGGNPFDLNIFYALDGDVFLNGTGFESAGTTGTATYTLQLKVARTAGPNGSTGLEQNTVAIPLFGTIFEDENPEAEALSLQHTISNVQAGETIQLTVTAVAVVTLTVGADAGGGIGGDIIPEPASLLLGGMALAGFGAFGLRRRHNPADKQPVA